MGNDNKEEQGRVTPRRERIYDWAGAQRERMSGDQTDLEKEYIPISQNFQNQYQSAADRQMGDYGNIMGGYQDWRNKGVSPLAASINARPAPKFNAQQIFYNRDPSTIGKAISGYSEFADTGGYSPTDIQEIRARGISPIRAAYGNSMMQLDRNRSLQGGYSPNYAAATESMQRMLPGQLAEATTNVNAGLAESIRSGRLAGMSGLTGIGGMETGAKMTAAQANQQADLRAQELTEQGMSAKEARQLAVQELMGKTHDAERQLYGTTPAMAATFGDQAQRAYQQRLQMEQLRNQTQLGLGDLQLQALGQQRQPGKPWWQTALEFGSRAAGSY